MRSNNILNQGLLVAAMLSLCGFAHAELAIVVHPDNSIQSISVDDVKRIFEGKSSSFPTGQTAEPINQAEGSSNRAEFLDKVLNKNESQLKAYWSQRIFTGKGSPPNTVADDAAVKAWITGNPSGLGYISAAAVDDSVKVVTRIP
ncbi:MAG: phosphate ABC transporter substrate-binding protein [Pseudomonadota bacterium]|nr:phosphate ABC transporter substrate-binding protein [Pseudomonadota bacterium]